MLRKPWDSLPACLCGAALSMEAATVKRAAEHMLCGCSALNCAAGMKCPLALKDSRHKKESILSVIFIVIYIDCMLK